MNGEHSGKKLKNQLADRVEGVGDGPCPIRAIESIVPAADNAQSITRLFAYCHQRMLSEPFDEGVT